MYILIKVLINVHLLVNDLCEYQNARCNDKNYPLYWPSMRGLYPWNKNRFFSKVYLGGFSFLTDGTTL